MTQSVLFFDSGVGGLSVLAEVRQLCPQLELRYLMDDAEFPYGLKPDDTLQQRVVQVCQQAVTAFSPDLLVIACNTASTLALPQLRQQINIPIVGVVPAIKPAAELAKGGHIGLLATPATVDRLYIQDLIQDFAEHCNVDRFGSSQLVQWAEDYLLDGKPLSQLKDHLQPWFNDYPAMSHVVLGCTHFPLLKQQLSQHWPHISWIDSGEAIARRVASLLHLSPAATSRSQVSEQPALSDAGIHLHWTSSQSHQPGAERFLRQLGKLQDVGSLPC